MVDEGYVVRERDEKDSRAYQITITDKTRKIMNEVFDVESEFESTVFKDLTEEEKEDFMVLLSKMSNTTEEMIKEYQIDMEFPAHPMRSKKN